MAAVPPAIGIPSGRTGNFLTGAVAITVLMVIAAVIFTVMEMMPFFSAVFHSADRITGIRLALALVMVSMGRNRDNKEGREYESCRPCQKSFFETHIYRSFPDR